MSREILFRGKCVSDSKYAGEWVTGGYVAPDADCKKRNEGLIVEYFGGNTTITYHVDPDTVGQFTGLVDKNGKRVFEGDILECVSWNEFWSVDGKPLEQFRRRLLVGHRNGAFVCIERQQAPFDDKVWDIISNHDCIIIGNIHDNPELFAAKQA